MDSTQDVKNEINLYLKVFGALGVLTVFTVAVAQLNVGIGLAILIAMIIATAKGTLVVGFFMHLLHEKKMIYLILIITLVFLMSLFFITFGTIGDQVGVKIVYESVSYGIHQFFNSFVFWLQCLDFFTKEQLIYYLWDFLFNCGNNFDSLWH